MIVVTAPTGQIGSQVLDRLLAQDEPVRVIVREPAGLSRQIRDRVEVVQGSHRDLSVVTEGFDGADAVFWLVPPDPSAESVEDAYVGFSKAAATALAGGGVGHVVNISALGRGTAVAGQAGYVTGSLAVDDLLAGTGVAFRAVTNPSFMDNVLRQAELIKNQGMLTSPISGDLQAPSCATRDIAEVAATLLSDRSWSGTGEVAVLGPEDLSFQDMAAIAADVLGRGVRFQQVSPKAYKSRMVEAGMSHAMAQGMLDMALAKDAGLDNGVQRTPEFSTSTSFRAWCEDTLAPAVQSRP